MPANKLRIQRAVKGAPLDSGARARRKEICASTARAIREVARGVAIDTLGHQRDLAMAARLVDLGARAVQRPALGCGAHGQLDQLAREAEVAVRRQLAGALAQRVGATR